MDHGRRRQDGLHRAGQPGGGGEEGRGRTGYIESFNARLRDELLDGEIFYSLREAQVVIESWRRHYNHVRPHASLGYRAPAPEGDRARLRLVPTGPAACSGDGLQAAHALTITPDHLLGAGHDGGAVHEKPTSN